LRHGLWRRRRTQAVAKIELRRAPTFAECLEAIHGQPADAFVYGNLDQPRLRRQAVEEILRAQRGNVAAAGEHHTGFQADSR
jgi:hypothetical protein